MGKKKLGALAAALVAADSLSDDEQKTLLEYLRAKQPKAPRKPAKKKPGPVALPDNPDGLKEAKVG